MHTPCDELLANPNNSIVAYAQQAPVTFLQSEVNVQF